MRSGLSSGLFAAIAMIAVFALILGGGYLLRSQRDNRRGWLMLAAATVLLGNVLIWTL